MKNLNFSFPTIAIILAAAFFSCDHSKTASAITWEDEWTAEIYPAEHRIETDSTSGAKLIYVTTDTAKDINLYFDWNCWFSDMSMMTFISFRNGGGELYGYVAKTGELIRLNPRAGKAVHTYAFVDLKTHDIYCGRDNAIWQWHVTLQFSADSTKVEKVLMKERKIAAAPGSTNFFGQLSQSGDRKYLSATLRDEKTDTQSIVMVDIKTGDIKSLLTWDNTTSFSHVQFNKYNKNLLRFSHSPHRMWYIDRRHPGEAHKVHLQEQGELVTHEDWWFDDQLTFCGGYLPEESHVKIINIHEQVTRIIGAGSWWEGGTPYELSQYAWWHASGSPDGKWVAADNFHGKIAIIDGRTSHLRLLTRGHRIYGGGEHPHVGWAPDSKSVEFTSHKLGDPNVVIAYIPQKWYDPFMETYETESGAEK